MKKKIIMHMLSFLPNTFFQSLFAVGILAGGVFGGLMIVLYFYGWPLIYLVAGVSASIATVLAIYPAMEAAQYADREVSKYRIRRRKGRMQGRVARA